MAVAGVPGEDPVGGPKLDGGREAVRDDAGQPLIEVPRGIPAEKLKLVEKIAGEESGAGTQFEYRNPRFRRRLFQAVSEEQSRRIGRELPVVVADEWDFPVDERGHAVGSPMGVR